MNKARSIMDERGDRKERKKDPNVLYSCLRAFIEEQPRQKAARKNKSEPRSQADSSRDAKEGMSGRRPTSTSEENSCSESLAPN